MFSKMIKLVLISLFQFVLLVIVSAGILANWVGDSIGISVFFIGLIYILIRFFKTLSTLIRDNKSSPLQENVNQKVETASHHKRSKQPVNIRGIHTIKNHQDSDKNFGSSEASGKLHTGMPLNIPISESPDFFEENKKFVKEKEYKMGNVDIGRIRGNLHRRSGIYERCRIESFKLEEWHPSLNWTILENAQRIVNQLYAMTSAERFSKISDRYDYFRDNMDSLYADSISNALLSDNRRTKDMRLLIKLNSADKINTLNQGITGVVESIISPMLPLLKANAEALSQYTKLPTHEKVEYSGSGVTAGKSEENYFSKLFPSEYSALLSFSKVSNYKKEYKTISEMTKSIIN